MCIHSSRADQTSPPGLRAGRSARVKHKRPAVLHDAVAASCAAQPLRCKSGVTAAAKPVHTRGIYACVLQSTPSDSRVPLSPRDNKTRPCHLQQRRILQQYVNRPQLPIPEHICGAAQDVLLISLRVDFEEEDRLGNKLIKPDDASALDDPPPVLLAWSQRLCLVDDLSYAVCLLTAFVLQ